MTITDDEVILTRDDIATELEKGASELFDMTAEEMMASYRAGVLDNRADILDLLLLAALLQKDDVLSPSYHR